MNNKHFTEPFNDDFLVYDETSGRYVITERGLEKKGIFLRSRIERFNTEYASIVISAYCETVANHIYTYMSDFAVNPCQLAAMIAHDPNYRRVMYNAQAEQAKFVYFNGDATLSIKPDERTHYIAPLAASALTNAGLTYAGGY
jgi:hypothetical protein